MACSHNAVFLLDTATSVEKSCLRLCTLKILNYLGARLGLGKVRWDFKIFDSSGTQGRTSRVGRFRELSPRAWEDFEEELEQRFGNRGCAPHLPGPAPRATLAQNILKETLLDYQWDRPEIASPAKPVLRSHKSKAAHPAEKPLENPTSGEFVNAIFLFSPCPHSQRELLQFVSGGQACASDALPPLPEMAEKFIPKGIQNMMASQKITLYWIDTSEGFTLLESPDHVGYWMLADLVRLLGGTLLPLAALARSFDHQRAGAAPAPLETPGSPQPWSTIVPFESTLSCLFSSPPALRAAFPSLEGALFLQAEGGLETRSCAVTLEPFTLGQRRFEGPVSIFLKSTMTAWDALHAGGLRTESWAVRGRDAGASPPEAPLFHQLMKCIRAHRLHMVAEVSAAGFSPPCTGVFSPTSDTTAVLSLLFAEPDAEAESSLLEAPAGGSLSQDGAFCLSKAVDRVLSQGSEDAPPASPAEALTPEWARQELSPTPHWSPALIESWYPLSNLCGASSHLMESFRLLQTGPAGKDEEDPKLGMELKQALSEFYQRRSSGRSAGSRQREHRRPGVPRTPVRQKMRSMPRSLQMLNAARLNAKAQKFQPEGERPAGAKASQRLFPRRPEDGAEERAKAAKSKLCFGTEEELLSYLSAHYQSAVAAGENILRFAREMVTAVGTFRKSNEEATADTIRSSLLKSSRALRQHLGREADREAQITECQLQVYLRLEMCRHCPSLQTDPDAAEDLVEEVTDLLRILCLTKDPGYLARFLEEVVDKYVEALPKILGDLYYSLGTRIPPKLASVLPADLFSDDSISQEGRTPTLPPSAPSAPGPASFTTDAEELEELRSRSAEKRRSTLARHRSVTEAPQNLRQIEVPQVPKNRSRKESARSSLNGKPEAAAQKGAVQEVTKVRRNLFNEKMLSPGKRALAKIPRSQSVSAVEGLKRKGSRGARGGGPKLLTQSVAETPLHKQISRRLLHKQIKGRSSDPGPEVCVVEESPEKSIAGGLRRSPRIQRRLTYGAPHGSFYRAESGQRTATQGCPAYSEATGDQENVIGLASPPRKKALRSPRSLLFGAVLDKCPSGGTDPPGTLSPDHPAVFATPSKSPARSSRRLAGPSDVTPRRSPRIRQKLQHVLRGTPDRTYAAAQSPGLLLSLRRRKSTPLPEAAGSKEGGRPSGGLSFLSRAPSDQEASGNERGQEAPEEVFASPSGGFDSAALLTLTPSPCCPSAAGRFGAALLSPRRSVRVGHKSATSARKLVLESRSWASPKRSTEEGPRGSGDGPSELSSQPKSANPVGAFPPAGSVVLPPNSPPWGRPLNATSASAFSPARTPGPPCSSPSQEPPFGLPKALCTSPGEPLQSPDRATGDGMDLAGHGGQGRAGAGWPAGMNPFCGPPNPESLPAAKGLEDTPEGPMPRRWFGSERGTPPGFPRDRHGWIREAVVLCEPLDPFALAGRRGQEASPQGDSSAEKGAGGERPPSRSPPGGGQGCPPATPKPSGPAYALRCTADRRQREAAARLGHPENMAAAFGAARAAVAAPPTAIPPTYEVELEMQASGLPKLRIKRVPSGPFPQPPFAGEPGPPEGEAATQAEPPPSRCGRHPGRPAEPPLASPPCVRSAHGTPGKPGGPAGQTYLCQAYTPTRCASRTASPSPGSAPWTPSPRQKGKVTPEAINDWPRRKRAGVGSERPARTARTPEPFGSGTKAPFPSEFELEGIFRLLDQSPRSDPEPSGEEGGCGKPLPAQTRKRALESTPPEEGLSPEVKRSCWQTASPGEQPSGRNGPAPSSRAAWEAEEVSGFPGLSPPSSSGKSSISARGLRALTESPLLYRGRPASLKKHLAGEDSEAFIAAQEDGSPFHGAVTRRRSLTRTYSRKRLLP